MLHLAARYLLAWKCMSRQNENPAKSAASHLMRGRIVRWLCESCAGSSGDLLTPSPPAENGIAAHPRQRGDRMTWRSQTWARDVGCGIAAAARAAITGNGLSHVAAKATEAAAPEATEAATAATRRIARTPTHGPTNRRARLR